jgi:hypothetical protein
LPSISVSLISSVSALASKSPLFFISHRPAIILSA